MLNGIRGMRVADFVVRNMLAVSPQKARMLGLNLHNRASPIVHFDNSFPTLSAAMYAAKRGEAAVITIVSVVIKRSPTIPLTSEGMS
jgi:hypothetical protein